MKKVLFLCVCALVCTSALFAQAAAGLGAVSGTVRDASGATVPGATVVVANDLKGIKRSITTTESGVFAAPALVPSSGYSIKVSKTGFADYDINSFDVAVGQTVDFKVVLQVGGASTKVDVVAEAPVVEDTKTDVSQVVGTEQIMELPINGRRVDTFVQLTPAVTKDGEFGLVTFRGVLGGNAFLTDGNDTTNQYYMENAGRTRAHAQISQDAVQEFQVLSAVAPAEFGRANGGVINTVTKSGGNDIHGTFYWFFRNRTLNARDRYAAINPPEVRHQAGGTIGGAIKKDKLFYFGNVEIIRRHNPLASSLINNAINSTTQTWTGCGAPATPAQCAAANALLPRIFGLVDRHQDEELGFVKLDYRPDYKNSFTASINYMRFLSPMGVQTGATSTNGGALGTNGDDSVRDRYGKLSWTFVPTGRIVNEVRFGWFKDRQADDVDPKYAAGWPIGNTALSVNSVSPLSGYNVLPRINPSEQRFQYADSFSYNVGRHALKFGVDYARVEDYSNSLTNRFGQYTYGGGCSFNGATVSSGVTCFALDFTNPVAGPSHWSGYSQAFGNPIVDTQIPDIAFFGQDVFKISRKLTVNYGVRYEKAFIPQPSITNPFYPQTGVIHQSNKNFAPRVGFAYSITDRTVFRGGYGLFYARVGSGMVNSLFTGNNVYTQSLSFTSPTQTGAPVFPNILASPAGTAGAASIEFASPNLRTPYSEQLDVALEHALSKSTTLTVSYIMSRGKQLIAERDLNVGPLSSTQAVYQILDTNLQPAGIWATNLYLFSNRVDPRFTRVMQVENGPMSWYDAMAVQLRTRLGKWFYGTIAYTWSHAIDENQSTAGNSGTTIFFSASGPGSYYNGDYNADKGTGQLDQRHRFVGTFVTRPTFVKSSNAFVKNVINGWEWTGLLTLASRRPTFETISSSLSTTNFPGAFTGTLNGLGGDNRVPFLQNNPLFIDPITRFDTRLTKNILFTERLRMALSFEVFNLTNTVSNTSVLTQGYTAGNRGTLAAPQYVITPCTSATSCASPLTPGVGTASAGFPDGTNARRAQAALRFTF
jgi:Carboxypeptidase regulatory-like domain